MRQRIAPSRIAPRRIVRAGEKLRAASHRRRHRLLVGDERRRARLPRGRGRVEHRVVDAVAHRLAERRRPARQHALHRRDERGARGVGQRVAEDLHLEVAERLRAHVGQDDRPAPRRPAPRQLDLERVDGERLALALADRDVARHPALGARAERDAAVLGREAGEARAELAGGEAGDVLLGRHRRRACEEAGAGVWWV